MGKEITRAREVRSQFERDARPHFDLLYSNALRLTRSKADADDLVQDTLVRAYRFYDRYQPGTNFKAWLLRIQVNLFANRYRRSTRERALFDGPTADPVGEGCMSAATMRGLADPVGEAERSIIASEIEQAFDELSDDARTIVLLADVHELPYKEIAEVIGKPVGTVMSRLHRARKQLKSTLEPQAVRLGIVTNGSETKLGGAPASLNALPDEAEGALQLAAAAG